MIRLFSAEHSLDAKIGPSILNSDLACLSSECMKLLDAGADYLHLDVMDGSFVPNLTFGHPVVKCLRKSLGPKPIFDMHMMVSDPLKWITPMSDAGANLYTFHFEATTHDGNDSSTAPHVIRKIRESGMSVGMGIKPNTPLESVLPFVPDVDVILIMTVEPGFGGQKFMPDMMAKVKKLRQEYPNLDIEVDGGVGPSCIEMVADAGANLIVSGTAIIGAPDQRMVITDMRQKVRQKLLERESSAAHHPEEEST